MSGLVAAALILTACGGGGGGSVAATVDGADITVEDVRSFPFERSSTLDTNAFAQYLNYLIQWTVLENAAEVEFGVAPDDAATDAEMERVLAEDLGGVTIEELAEQQQISEGIVRRLVRLGLIQEAVADNLPVDDPPQADIDTAISAERANLTEVCVRHLLVDTVEAATDARSRIEGGEEFTDVATEVSTDPSAADNGGDLGCAPAQQYVTEFRDASVALELDALSEPVETQYGFHVLMVYDRTEPDEATLSTEDEVREALKEQATSTALQGWLLEKVTNADVTVEEEFGTWTVEPTPSVQPPAG